MLLVSQMREMNVNYMAVTQELQDIKNQMNNQQSMSQISGNSSLIVNQLVAFEDDIRNQYHQFQGIAQKLNDKAGILIHKFKDVPAVPEAQNPAENAKPISEKQPSIFEKLRKHFQRNLKKFSDRVDKLDKAIEKINKIEHEVDRASVRTDKASIKEKLENNRALIEAKESSEPKQVREKHQEEMAL